MPNKLSRTAIGAAYQAVLVALYAAAGSLLFLHEHLARAVAGGAGRELEPAAGTADEGRVLPGGALEDAAELAGLVQPADLVGAADEHAPDQELREREPAAPGGEDPWSSRRSAASMETSRSSTATRSPRSAARTAQQSANVRRTPRSDVV